MLKCYKLLVCVGLLVVVSMIFSGTLHSQEFSVNGRVLLKAEITLGNQNKGFKLGIYGVGNAQVGAIAMESGVGFYNGFLFGRHATKSIGVNAGYDAFGLIGVGKNDNLLVSSFFADNPLNYNVENNQNFVGIGFGFEKEFLPKSTNEFNQRLGKLLLRIGLNNQSINIQFKNDLRIGSFFLGSATDFGSTGALIVSFSRFNNFTEALHVGIGVQLFTPRQDYNRTPDNYLNSDDGSKNVWHTKGKHNNLFYANFYGFGGYQKDTYFGSLKAGVNSQKFGAFVQNKLHDGFGLNPRFPWNTAKRDRLFFELNGGIFNSEFE